MKFEFCLRRYNWVSPIFLLAEPVEIQEASPRQEDSQAIPLPDIRQALQRKQVEDELSRAQEEEEGQRVRISRNDKVAMAKVSKSVYWFKIDADTKYLAPVPAFGTTTVCRCRRVVF
jgi:hypothetical protein